MNKKIILFICFIIFFSMHSAYSLERHKDKESTVHLRANRVTINKDGSIHLQGPIIFSYEDYILKSKSASYNLKRKKITFTKKVSIKNVTNKNTFITERVTFNAKTLSGLTGKAFFITSKGKFGASSIAIEAKKTIVINDGWFTACPCQLNAFGRKFDQNAPTTPAWRIRAHRIELNRKTHIVTFDKAVFDIFGIPVMYLPHFTTYDNTVKRKSGFLAPRFFHSTELGMGIRLPFYFDISPSADATLAPTFYSEENPFTDLKFRQRTKHGLWSLRANGLWSKSQNLFRGSFFSQGAFYVGQHIESSFTIQTVTDNTYLEKYDINSNFILKNNIHFGYHDSKNDFNIDGYSFSNLDYPSMPFSNPKILPIISYEHNFYIKKILGRFSYSINHMVFGCKSCGVEERLINTIKWEKDWLTQQGVLFNTFMRLRGDVYHINGDITTNQKNFSQGYKTRILPTMATTIKYPIASHTQNWTHVVTPIVQAVFSPLLNNKNNKENVPNLDSQDIQFNAINLFSIDKIPGYDLVDYGIRANIGIKYQFINNKQNKAFSFLFGQSFHKNIKNEQNINSENNFLNKNSSDYVGSFNFNTDNIQIAQQFRFDRNRFSAQSYSTLASVKSSIVQASLWYGHFAPNQTLNLPKRDELSPSLAIKASKKWKISLSSVYNAQKNAFIENKVGLTYQSGCLSMTFSYKRSLSSYMDIHPNSVFSLSVSITGFGSNDNGTF